MKPLRNVAVGFFLCVIWEILLDKSNASFPATNQEGALKAELLAGYNPDVKPTTDANTPITVTFRFILNRIEGLNEKLQLLSSIGMAFMIWHDDFLRWNSTVKGLDKMVMNADKVWLPEVRMIDSIGDQLGVDLGREYGEDTRVTVTSEGLVSWDPIVPWRTYCQVDLTLFPYDTQTCTVGFASLVYNGGILFRTNQTKLDLDSYDENGQWDLIDHNVRNELLAKHPSRKVPHIEFSVTLSRKPAYFLLSVVIPSMLMTMTSLLVFVLPVESGEKVSLGITIMLSYFVMLLVVSDVTPRSGSTQPLLAHYMVLSMILTATSVVATVVILNIFYHDPTKRVPNWLYNCTFSCLATITCFSRRKRQQRSNSVNVQPDNTSNDVSIIELKEKAKEETAAIISRPATRNREWMDEIDNPKETQERNKKEWARVARIIDRFCLFIALISILGLTSFFTLGIHFDKD